MSFLRKPALFSLVLVVSIICFSLVFRHISNQSKWKFIVIHHTASDKGSLESIRTIHMRDRNWPDIAYHFIINNGTHGTQMGQIEASNLWFKGYGNFATLDSDINEKSIAIALVGNFEKNKVKPRQWLALVNLVVRLTVEHQIPITHIKGHRQISSSVCPGKNLSIEQLQKQVRVAIAEVLEKV